MKFIRRISRLRLLPKLILTFLLVLSPLYFIGLKMNVSGSGIVRNEISNSLSSRVDLYMEILESDFSRTVGLLQQYVNDDDLLKLSTSASFMTDIERMDSILRLKSRLDLLKSSSNFIANVIAYIPDIDRSITSNEIDITNFNRVEFEALRQANNRFQTPFIVWQDRLFISISYPDPSINKSPRFVMAVEISRQALETTLSRFTNEGGGAVLTGKNSLWTVSGAVDVQQGKKFLQQVENERKQITSEIGNVKIDNMTFMVAQKDSETLNATLLMFVPTQSLLLPLQTYRMWLIILSLSAVAIMFAFSFSIYRMIHRPLRILVAAFRKLEQGDFEISLKAPFQDEFGFLYERFNATVRQLGVLVHEVYEQQYRAQSAELRHLQSQINPHFLYNTYFILYRMAKLHDNENLIHLTKHLGEYFQYITRDGSDKAPFDKEAQHAKSYMEIQSIRFRQRIKAVFEPIPQEVSNILVPRLILQPIIENAYNYALEQKAKDGLLIVNSVVQDGRLLVVVEDNGDQITPESLKKLQMLLSNGELVAESTGLVNVHRRLRIQYGPEGGIQLDIGSLGGLKVTIIIPLERE
ncbi:HAMP domain-containing protein [Paenibacillus sp. LMG 31461]|uniref:HAMP domain-containing protein n=1 Tax=Paenibacillus plantarum TaxID=2654975 RepID=A0ABX1X479_9BACL|nr:histidine kinase [Paenibacillus plantarum]NOU62825.1 HAMP domain-containing protein [Paenibacillus plantarum]